jgi:apolipoprotein N-acyltransferase
VAFLNDVRAPAGWQGVDTNFSRLSSAGSDDAGQLLAAMKRVEWVRKFAERMPAHSVRVLPETVLGSVDGMAELALHDAQATLMARGSRLLAGAELLQADGRYQNAVMVLGAKAGEQRMAVQNIPVPVSMWRPWAPDGAVADVFGMGNVIEVNGARSGVVVCYEQLLPFSLLWVMMSRPDVIVAVSNVWWARETSIPDIQRQTVDAFGRLFGVAVVAAKNS